MAQRRKTRAVDLTTQQPAPEGAAPAAQAAAAPEAGAAEAEPDDEPPPADFKPKGIFARQRALLGTARPPVAAYVAPVVARQPAAEYGPDRKIHMSKMGLVAAGNVIGVIEGVRVSVKYGAPKSRLPPEVIAMMEGAGVGFFQAEPPKGTGATIVKAPEEPRARRAPRPRNPTERRFAAPMDSVR